MDENYVFYYNNLAKLVVTGIVPFVALSIFNYKIHAALKKRQKVKQLMKLMTILENVLEFTKTPSHPLKVRSCVSIKKNILTSKHYSRIKT